MDEQRDEEQLKPVDEMVDDQVDGTSGLDTPVPETAEADLFTSESEAKESTPKADDVPETGEVAEEIKEGPVFMDHKEMAGHWE